MKHAFDTNYHRHFLLLRLCLALAFNLAVPTQGADDASGLAGELIRASGLKRGLCAVLGIDGELPLQLAQGSEMLIHVRDPRSKEVYALRERADGAKLGIHRLTAETGGFARLPYADNTIDLVIASQVGETTLKELSVSEVLRVLRPEGIALLGNRSAGTDRTARQLQNWAGAGGVRSRIWSTKSGQWIQIKKPELAGVDDWSHWEKAPDNNPVSNDQVIKAPYMTQFLADPLYIGMPSITTAAGGRTFLAIGHISHHEREWGMLLKLIARNGYNGQVLWQRDLPEGYAVHRSAFIATKETFYMINGDHCLMLNPQTGAEQGVIRLPEVKGEWKWMALHNGVLYALLGKPEPGVKTMKGDRSFGGWSWADLSEDYYAKRLPFGFGDTLAAFDLKSKELRWMHKDEHLIDARGMAIQGNRIFLYAPDHYLRCLTADTGSQRWLNDDKETLGLIEAPGQGLRSTPGFRTACLVVASPGALVIQGQTRMNVIGVSTENGRLLWTKPKVTNNPNALFVDGRFILGVGQNGSHVAIDPATGNVAEDLKFLKAACTRLTASTDSFFCRGEGTLRFDRASKKLQIDGTARPACNDGALPANGMLYLGPWQCDCNLSIIGHLGRCSAGDFRFDRVATDAERLQRFASDLNSVQAFPTTEKDWPTYRANDHRSASSPVPLAQPANVRWQYTPGIAATPTAPTAAGGLIFSAGQDGKVRAIDAGTGALRWEHLTPAPIKQPPTIWEGRAYVGSGDGHVYALEAATGRLLWRFRAAPVERHLMVYGNLCSTWPVNSGVLVHDGVAYFAAGMIDHDGTCVYALNARTGALQWQNNSSGHLNPELRKGVSAQGNLTIQGGHLLLAGGNVVSPARFDLKTGKCLATPPQQGRPSANSGQFVGVFRDQTVIAGGRILYSSPRNVSNKNGFDAEAGGKRFRFSMGGIPPAWNDAGLVYVNSMFGKLNYCEAGKVAARIEQGYAGDGAQRDRPPQMITLAQSFERKGELRWQSASGEKFEVLSLAVCPNAIVGVVRFQEEFRSQPQWWLTAFAPADGRLLFRQELTTEPLPGGLLIDRRGQAVVSMLNGELWCLGPRQ